MRVIKQSPWNMNKASDWLTALVEANNVGHSRTWVPPTKSRVVSGNHASEPAIMLSVPRVLPAASPVPVTMEDKKRRLRGKRPLSLQAESQRKRACLGQRDRNLSPPSAIQSVAGAPLAEVNENGPPENVVAPPVVNGCLVATLASQGMSVRLRNQLLKTGGEPTLGCGRCRHSAVGCATCRRKRDCWRQLYVMQS